MNRSHVRWLLVMVFVLAWVTVIVAGYYVVHKPLTGANLSALLSTAGDLLTWLALMAVGTALGSRLTRRLPYGSLLERLTFSAGLGLALFSLATLALGLSGLLYRWLFWALLLAGGLLFRTEFRDLVSALRHLHWPSPRGKWAWLLTLFIASTLLLALLLALAPPVEWDGLTYHLVGPERYLQAHRLTFAFDNYYLFFPEFSEMLFTAGMALKGDVVTHLLHFSYLLLTLGAIGSFAARTWRRRTGLLATALFLSIPTATQIATWAYVDLTLTFYGFASFYALFVWLQAEETRTTQGPDTPGAGGWLLLAGLFSGASASIKYTGLAVLLGLCAVLLWAVLRRRLTARRFGSGLLAISGWTLLIVSPWYLKNLLVAGNPIYPLVWGGQGWNDISTRWLLVLGEKKTLLDLALIPWTLTVIGTQGTVAYDATFSPLHLTLLPMLFLVDRRARGIAELLLVATVGYVAWIASGSVAYGRFVLQGRMVLPVFAALSLLCAYALDGLQVWDRPAFSLQRFLKLVTALVLAFGLVTQILTAVKLNPTPYQVGNMTRDEYRTWYSSQGWYESIAFINENLSADDSVLFFWEPRGYSCRVPCDADVLFDNWAQALARHGSPDDVARGLYDQGVTHLLVNQFIYPSIVADYPLTAAETAAWEAFEDRYLTEEAIAHQTTYMTLYRVLPVTRP